jgi:putative tryptophan/tyrosine transport system substrate-binding protein
MRINHLKRREIITLLGGAAATWPLAARAQQPVMPLIGYLYAGFPEPSAHLVAAFRKGLSETGYVEGRNVTIEYRWAEGRYDRLPELAVDLVRQRVAVIATPGASAGALAAKAATTTIPIVFAIGSDPVQIGLVASLNRPGGNITGVSEMAWELMNKRLEMLHDLLPGAIRFAVLVNPTNLGSEVTTIKDMQAAAAAIGLQVEVFYASNNREIDTAFANLVQKRASARLIGPDVLFANRRLQLVTRTVREAMPAIYPFREDAEAGGLMSYGASLTDRHRIYTGRILQGEKPADLPVLRATKFEFVINLQTAKVIGLDVPPTLLALADQVIE